MFLKLHSSHLACDLRRKCAFYALFTGVLFDFPIVVCYNQKRTLPECNVKLNKGLFSAERTKAFFLKRSGTVKGNQVKILSDPVTVSRE